MLPAGSEAAGGVRVELTSREEVSGAWSGPLPQPYVRETIFPDGCLYRLERGARSDHLLAYGSRAVFHLSPHGDLVRCAPAQPGDPAWQRFLLDTVLATVSLVHGFEALHASAVRYEEGSVGFLAEMGGGKTALAAELVRRGHPLFCDDVLVLGGAPGAPVSHPGPPLMNLPLEGPGAEGLGATVVAELDGEAWVALDQREEEPRPVRALFLLDRGGPEDPAIEALARSPRPLLGHAIPVRPPPERARKRFELFGDLAARVSQYRLHGGDAEPPELADLVERTLERELSGGAVG
jgi:hypothetical protein